METLIRKMIELRKANGFSQAEIAEMLYASRQTVYKWENGQSIPNADNLKLLAEIYGVSVDWLLDYETEPLAVHTQNKELEEKITILQRRIKKQHHFCCAVGIALLLSIMITSFCFWRIHESRKEVLPLRELSCDQVADVVTEDIDLIPLK